MRVAMAGASGLVGQHLLAGLLADPRVSAVHAFGRRPLGGAHPALTTHTVDFAALPALPPCDAVYLALGTTRRAAGSRAAFRAVDFDATVAFARAARAAGAQRAGLVSAIGADPDAAVHYNRVKGEVERAVADLDFDGLVIARPSLLLGDRAALGQPVRPIERLMAGMAAVAPSLIPLGVRPIAARDVACALLAAVPRAQGIVVLTSAQMQGAHLSPAR